MKKTKGKFGPLLKNLRALPETAMRREVLLLRFLAMEPADVLLFLQEVLSGVDKRNHLHLAVLEAVHQVLLDAPEKGPLYEVLAEAYRLAREQGADGVIRLLLSARPRRGPALPQEIPGDHELSRLTLGERKFLARGHDRLRLGRLLIDPDPSVARNLLQNPGVTEQDVVGLAARRPLSAKIPWVILESRFGSRYRVRLTLIRNPYTPTELSLKLLGFLLWADLKEVARDGNLHPLVQEEALRLWHARRGKEIQQGEGKEEEDPLEPNSGGGAGTHGGGVGTPEG